MVPGSPLCVLQLLQVGTFCVHNIMYVIAYGIQKITILGRYSRNPYLHTHQQSSVGQMLKVPPQYLHQQILGSPNSLMY